MELLDHPGRCVKRRVSRRMTATIDGSEGCEVLAREIVRVARAVGLPTAAVFRCVDGSPTARRPVRTHSAVDGRRVG